MDSSPKPEKKNPRQSAGIFSQLTFFWAIPLLFRGSRKGLNTEDLTQCLKKDQSEDLGDRLQKHWFREVETAKRDDKQPSLVRALFHTFWLPCTIDGFTTFIYVILKSVIPVALAQLLLQFQPPMTPTETPSIESNLSAVTTQPELLLNRSERNALYNLKTGLPIQLRDALGFGDDSHAYLQDSISNIISDFDDKGYTQQDIIAADTKNLVYQNFSEITTTTIAPAVNTSMAAIDEVTNFFYYIWNDVYWLATIVVVSTVIGCFIQHHVDLRLKLLGARMRIACCSLIYRKTLRLSKKTAGRTPAGYLVNLLSNDVSRLDWAVVFIHYIWIMPIQAVLICYLIWQKIGIAALIGVLGLLLKTIPVQTALSKLSATLRMRIAKRTDTRIGIMNELVQGIQVIKMYAWEKPFQAIVAEARRAEIKQIRYASYLRGFYLSTMVFTERSTLFLTMTASVLLGSSVTADVAFSMAQFYNILQLVAAIFYPLAMSFGAEALVSIERVQEYLLMEDHDDKCKGLTQKNDPTSLDEKSLHTVLLRNITARWQEQGRPTLSGINLEVKEGQLCAIIGPVGAGKSSLLQLLLGELPIIDGTATILGEISYASQEPWLFTGSVRNNILFGEEYNRKRYQEVTKCCALAADFEQLPHGDKSVVGERGASLSGGQRARISLARAVYKNASIYLLDDPLSAVDAHVGRHLFDEVIGPRGCLAKSKTTRFLVTHQVHFLTEADVVVIIENGKISRQGSYKELANSDLDFAKLLERHEKEDEKAEEPNGDLYEDEEIPYIDGAAGYQALRKKSRTSSMGSAKKSQSIESNIGNRAVGEEQAEGGVPLRIWGKYFRAGGNACLLTAMVLVLLISQIVASGSDYFVSYWSQQEYLRENNQPTTFSTYDCIYIYGGLILGVVFMTILRGYMFFNICMRASKNLHNRMFGRLLHASMRFFDTNPSGRILNRFSRDMGSIDELLPRALMDALQIGLVMTGILVVISLVNPILLGALAIAVLFFYLILQIYLQPAQDLKRLEGICRSPVFSHLSATLSGISTIRARKLQEVVAKEFDLLQDVHSSVWQLTMSANNALGLWLDMISCAFVATVAFSFILIHQKTFSGNVGLAISQSMILTGMVQYGVRQVAESLQQMTSVERVVQYTDLDQEPNPKRKPQKDWPQKGRVHFNNMSLRYDPDSPPVLKHLQIVVQPAWKVGIVGRTGAGKSSLIGALFRLSHIEGEVIIDDVETGTIELEELRSKISIIPQDPVLFSASIRYNLDPFGLYKDADLWKALEEVELKQAIPGLEYMVTECGSNFSVGQRQLVCLARAILRNNKILVLDEATANVDPQTDALIQRTIRQKFKHCTVLTVAHRLHTVMDSDRILVMDAGYAKEFDHPHILLQKPEGILYSMVQATGPHDSETLRRVAEETYRNNSESTDDILPNQMKDKSV